MSDDFRILVAVDHQTGTDRLLAEAQRYGRALNAVIDIIHVAEPDPDFVGYLKIDNQEATIRESKSEALRSEHQRTHAVAESLRKQGLRVDHSLTVQGPTLETILQHVSRFGSNLLMLGSHRHGALHRFWFGENTVEAAKHPPCALLIVPVGNDAD
jgi:nucleotide-binding universal stress UspA family protein